MSWVPPSTLRERLKRAIVPPRQELKRVIARELRKGEPELRLLPQLVDPNRVAIDVGANRGVWSHQMASLCPQVFAFEPNPKIFAILDAARPANVVTSPIALSDCPGRAELSIPRSPRGYSNQHGSLSGRWAEGAEFGVVDVETACLDDLDLPPCGLIKIDVEGHELAVIDGARRMIARDRPTLLVEIEERHSSGSIEASITHIEALGYRMAVMKAGALQDGAAFDPQSDHRDRVEQPGYIFNFIFRPI